MTPSELIATLSTIEPHDLRAVQLFRQNRQAGEYIPSKLIDSRIERGKATSQVLQWREESNNLLNSLKDLKPTSLRIANPESDLFAI